MDEEIVVPAMFFLTVIVLVIVIPIIKAWYVKAEAQLKQPPLTPELATRLDRLEAMIETVAVEVERMSESQRFTTRLLAEGSGQPVMQPPRTVAATRDTSNEVTHA